MATTGIVNGTNLRFYMENAKIGEATSCTLNLSRETRDTLTKDTTGSWASFAPGRKSGTCDIEGLVSFSTTNEQVSDIFTAFDNGTSMTMRFTTDVNGDTYYECEVIFTSMTLTAAVEENATYSATATIIGAVTQGTES
jgi:predicted secreted protein